MNNNLINIPEHIKNNLLKQKEQEDVSIEEIESFGDKESLLRMYTEIKNYSDMLDQKITFINEELTQYIPFTQNNLYLLCAYTGSGKSTTSANIAYPLWQEGRKTLVLSNEESEEDILFRIGCIHLGYSFNAYKKNTMEQSEKAAVMRLFPDIAKYVKILDVNYKKGFTTRVEGIKAALEQIKDKDYACVLIDYFQLIKYSSKNRNQSTYDVLNDLRIWLGRYIKESSVPVVLFAQLHSLGKRNNSDLDSRIKEAPTIMEPATVVIEIVPDVANFATDFIIKKDRFGFAGNTVKCGFDRGKFVPYTKEFEDNVQATKILKVEEALEDIDE